MSEGRAEGTEAQDETENEARAENTVQVDERSAAEPVAEQEVGMEAPSVTLAHRGNESGRYNTQFVENLTLAENTRRAGGFAKHTETLPGFTEAFKKRDAIRCSDEGETRDGYANPGALLYDLFVTQVPRAELAALYHKQGIKKLISHDECGAAKIAMMASEGGDPSWDEVNAWAKKITGDFAAEFGFRHEHTASENLHRPEHFHPGTAIYLDYVGGFQPQSVKGIEQGYLVSGTIGADPIGAVRILLERVAFNNGNAGDLIRDMRKSGQWALFNIYVLARSDAEAKEKVDAVYAMLDEIDPGIKECINVESKVVNVTR